MHFVHSSSGRFDSNPCRPLSRDHFSLISQRTSWHTALYKINPLNFDTKHVLTGWSFIGFSFGKLTPSSISSMIPNGPFPTILCYLELFCALLILVFSVLTAAGEKYKEDIDEFITELTLLGKDMQNHFCTLYCLALSDIEKLMIDRNGAMVNLLRKTRGVT